MEKLIYSGWIKTRYICVYEIETYDISKIKMGCTSPNDCCLDLYSQLYKYQQWIWSSRFTTKCEQHNNCIEVIKITVLYKSLNETAVI